ncbi:trypsin-like peptidase domain-containing protein [Candidatus Saccharibacteria bacterium]|nr:MAG: trypsin-like peptidase domain-containing protein [Candidatus Saccharibacteria bacterium]
MDIETSPQQKENSAQKLPAKKATLLTKILIGLIIFSISFGGGWLGASSKMSDTDSRAVAEQKTIVTNTANLVSSIAGSVGGSVVSVNVTSQSTATGYGGLFDFGYGPYTQESAGTGVIISSDGLIMTNRHVVPTGTTDVSVTLSDGTVLDKVKVIARTSSRDTLDIAFLKVEDDEGKKLVAAKLGDSSKMKVGDAVVAIGNTLGQFQNTVTSGIISGYGRSLVAGDGSGDQAENLDDMFQTDAAINQGNSGGPLVNMNGEVIGINTAIASDAQTVGFAIPINNVKGLIENVRKSGKLERPYLGVVYVMLTDDIAEEYNLGSTRGAYIPKTEDMGSETVIKGGPAAEAGIAEGDIITKIDGTDINEKSSLLSILSKHKAGDSVELTILRGDATKTISVKLGIAPAN